ncbi:MAG: shikimate dehydrogenase [Lachnospiraceae bacterium]|nr:shikimate dehydrogenase [Lachnospiraceae bacterium]
MKSNREINARTGLLGLLGHPVAHSVSPYLQNHLAAICGDDLRYLAFDIEDEEALEDAIWGAYAMGVKGFNVTVPYKKAVMDYLEQVEENALQIGAVNTLKREADGWYGYNTDMPGLIRALHYDKVQIEGKKVVLIGAGGAANAALCAVLEMGAAEVLVLNRTRTRAEQLAKRFIVKYPKSRIRTRGMDQDFVGCMRESGTDWIALQTTSVGMHPDVNGLAITEDDFYKLLTVGYDIIFNPAETAFMKKVEAAGGRAYNGLRMLLFQGIRSYEIWNGVQIGDEAAEELLQGMREQIGK